MINFLFENYSIVAFVTGILVVVAGTIIVIDLAVWDKDIEYITLIFGLIITCLIAVIIGIGWAYFIPIGLFVLLVIWLIKFAQFRQEKR